MKKGLKVAFLAGIAAATCFAMSSCGGTAYTGEYHYSTSYGFDYGVKVEVTVSTVDEVKVIKSVKILDRDYHTITDAETWTEEGVKNYTDNEAALLKSFEGMKVSDVKAYTVQTVSESEASQYAPAGQPKEGGITPADGSIKLISGATQCTGRLILAVQDAIKDL
jgi:hypothetical protein